MAARLFTGDAGQGESNIRRWIIENDWLEAIVALPLNLFYNTGIATYVWVLTNRKPEHRRGKVQLIDATAWHRPLRKNLGKKNCELGEDDIERICETFLAFKENEQSKIFENEAFGYWKVTVERPLRIEGAEKRAHKAAEIRKLKAEGARKEDAPPVIKRIHKRGTETDPLHGLFEDTVNGKLIVVEYEPDTELRDTEQIPLQEKGGIDAFLRREVLPYAPDAWYRPGSVKIGYEISFNRHFYKPPPMRTLAEIRADIVALEREAEGLLGGLMAREPRATYKTTRKLRVYVDTSVIGGCEDEEFREASQRLIERCAQGEVTLVISEDTVEELKGAPRAVQNILQEIANPEAMDITDEVEKLASRYIQHGALTEKMRADARHIAAATVAEVDVLVSWNFRHMVNIRRIQQYNDVNRQMGYGPIEIRSPRELEHG